MGRYGKIASLPRELRDQVNRLLDDGEQGVRLVEWLNELPEVQAVLARNLAAAATRTVRAIIKNEPVFVPVAVREHRQALCAACDYNLNGRCRLCGCCVKSQIFRKTQLAAEECPLNPPKWLKML